MTFAYVVLKPRFSMDRDIMHPTYRVYMGLGPIMYQMAESVWNTIWDNRLTYIDYRILVKEMGIP